MSDARSNHLTRAALLRVLRTELARDARLDLVAVLARGGEEILACAGRGAEAEAAADEILGMAEDAGVNAETLEWLYARARELPSPEVAAFGEVMVHGEEWLSVFLAEAAGEAGIVARLEAGAGAGLALHELRDLQRRLGSMLGSEETLW